MTCPVCGGGHTLPLTTGLSRCITTRLHRAPGPGQAGLPGPPVIDTYFTCNTEFADADVVGIGRPCHGCDRDAVGHCVECGVVACGYHSGFHDWSRRLCVAHWEQERDEAAAAAKAIEEDLARRRQALTADAEAAAVRVRARRTEIVAELRQLAGALARAGSPGAIRANNPRGSVRVGPKVWRLWVVLDDDSQRPGGPSYPGGGPGPAYGVAEDGTRLWVHALPGARGRIKHNASPVAANEDLHLERRLAYHLRDRLQAVDGAWPADMPAVGRMALLDGLVAEFVAGHEAELAGLRSVAAGHGVTI